MSHNIHVYFWHYSLMKEWALCSRPLACLSVSLITNLNLSVHSKRRLGIILPSRVVTRKSVGNFLFYISRSSLPSSLVNMGLRSWWRRFRNKMISIAASWFHSDNFQSTAYLNDGGTAVWQGRPVGWKYETFEELCRSVDSKRLQVVDG